MSWKLQDCEDSSRNSTCCPFPVSFSLLSCSACLVRQVQGYGERRSVDKQSAMTEKGQRRMMQSCHFHDGQSEPCQHRLAQATKVISRNRNHHPTSLQDDRHALELPHQYLVISEMYRGQMLRIFEWIICGIYRRYLHGRHLS